MATLLRRGGKEKLRVYFLGAKEAVVTRLVALCQESHSGLTVAGYRNGYFSEADHDAVIDDIERSGAHVLFIGMPSPFKEVFAERNRHRFNVPVILGVGGSFDVLAGFVKRAPPSWQRFGMEWFWRLLMEPRKLWRRYLVTNTLFLGRVAREVFRSRG
jgi:N-acetylglucosaminyldiphosphoundecaprenol N-acetyl-beta-D-mannosaminyltransferase